MRIFDLLFLFLLLAATASLIAAAWFGFRKQFGRARRIFRTVLVGAGAYMAVVVLVSLIAPRGVLKQNSVQCFDDWCIGIAGFSRVPESADSVYRVNFR